MPAFFRITAIYSSDGSNQLCVVPKNGWQLKVQEVGYEPSWFRATPIFPYWSVPAVK